MTVIDKIITGLQLLISRGDNFPNFIKEIDSFNKKALPIFVESGLTPSYAEAFLLKISNFIVGKYQYTNRHENLVSRPYALFIDPSNGCPLHCPGCLHNEVFQKKITPDWPNGLLSENAYTSFIEQFGPYASSILFYNWGEPLLNRNTPKFIKQAKNFLLHTSLSSNLCVNFDAEAIVKSGLDYMILSVDGASAKTYEQYRQGGNFNLAIKNIKRLVRAREKLRVSTPFLCWQFLLFEHNKHEIEAAKAMARELGVDVIRFITPYDTIWQPDIEAAKNCQAEKYKIVNNLENHGRIKPVVTPSFSGLFQQKWRSRLRMSTGESWEKRTGKTCKWLYSTIVMDALERYLPCCYVPRKKAGFTYIFANSGGNIVDNGGEVPFNSEYYHFSRTHFVWLSELKRPGGQAPMLTDNKHVTYCVACPNRKLEPLVTDSNLKHYLQDMNTTGILSEQSIKIISAWTI